MKVLVATPITQGIEPDDVCRALDGELVVPLLDGAGFAGLVSERPTSSAMVVELPTMTVEMLADAVRQSLARRGRLGGAPAADAAVVRAHLDAIDDIGAWFPTHSIIGRRGGRVWSRDVALAA